MEEYRLYKIVTPRQVIYWLNLVTRRIRRSNEIFYTKVRIVMESGRQG